MIVILDVVKIESRSKGNVTLLGDITKAYRIGFFLRCYEGTDDLPYHSNASIGNIKFFYFLII